VQHVISTALVGFISWNPEIRNVLSVLIGIAVLMGSVILIVSTNTGPRTGMLVGLACLFGWMMVMGLTWTLYGIGLKGKAPHWKVVEISYDLQQASQPEARQLPELDDQQKVKEILAARPDLLKKVNPEGKDKVISISELVEADPSIEVQFGLAAKDLGGWHILVPSDKQRGDAQASADAALGADGKKIFEDSTKYKVVEAFDTGGKQDAFPIPSDPSLIQRVFNRIETTFHISQPEHYAIVQVQAVVPQETPPGGAPPTPKFDESQPVVSVIMIRDVGNLRYPSFLFTFVFGLLFALTCWTLHRRDKLIARNRAAV
jgi:hypothetical protein